MIIVLSESWIGLQSNALKYSQVGVYGSHKCEKIKMHIENKMHLHLGKLDAS